MVHTFLEFNEIYHGYKIVLHLHPITTHILSFKFIVLYNGFVKAKYSIVIKHQRKTSITNNICPIFTCFEI